ncbi:O-antigen polysaccharide polymerase Wzy [Exiguobacterium sp. UBA4551]|uniref:O-antigen polysaccharide polymerase Wzy n=1 Tax=Exiguobacterium sp. UBA4551 TaxID=1946494 RepID=UPI0010575FAD|nr:O-antigen polysaccharide polymerase Wzy [Exiguobacterium sp. UBA4551]
MKTTLKIIFVKFGFLVTNMMIFLILHLSDYNLKYLMFGSFIQIITIFVYIYFMKPSFLSISIIFFLFSYVFHFGQVIINIFEFNDIFRHRSVYNLTNEIYYKNALIYSIYCHFFIAIGIKYTKNYLNESNKSEKKYIINFDNFNEGKFRKIILIIFTISIGPLIYLDISKISALMNSGYLSTYDVYSTGIEKYFYIFSSFARSSITLLIISFRKNERISKIILLTSTLYFFIMMASGDRGTNIIYIITNLFIYYKLVKKLSVSKIICFAILGYFVLGMLSSLTIMRTNEDMSFSTLLETFNLRSDQGVLYSTFREFGFTLISLVYSIQFTGSINDFNYGMSYIASFLGVIPKIPSILSEYVENSFTFTKTFPINYQASLGGSYLGELYFNFGWIGIFFSYFIGSLLNFLDNVVEKSVINNKVIPLSICAILLPNLLLWTRGFFVEISFEIFWFSLIFIFSFSKYYKGVKNDEKSLDRISR